MAKPTLSRAAVAAALALCTMTFLAPPAGARHASWHAEGKLTLHDEPDWPATLDVADCAFWVRGEGVEVQEGTVDVRHNQGRAGSVSLVRVNFSGTPNEDGGFDFLVGPVTLEATDHVNGIRVFAEVVVAGERTETSDPERALQSASVRVHCGGKFIPCIDDLAASALDEGHVRLAWSPVANATHYFVSRSDGTQLPNGQLDWEILANVTATTFTDATAQPGVTYLYEVTSSDGALAMNGSCPIVEVTAVPFFGAPLLGAVAAVGAVGGYAWLRRR